MLGSLRGTRGWHQSAEAGHPSCVSAFHIQLLGPNIRKGIPPKNQAPWPAGHGAATGIQLYPGGLVSGSETCTDPYTGSDEDRF